MKKENTCCLIVNGIEYIRKPNKFVTTHNFPKGKDVCLHTVISNKDIKEILKLCFENGVNINNGIIEKGFRKQYLCFGESEGSEKLCVCDSEHFTMPCENTFSVGLEEFKAFIRGEGIVPEVFKEDKVELEVGKWYTCGDDAIFCHQEKHSSYGFLRNQWIGKWGTNPEYFSEPINEATTEEITEALTKEAVKRYKVGDYIKFLDNFIYNQTDFNKIDNVNFNVSETFNSVFIESNGWNIGLFKDGKWATILETITKEKAEKELGKKIID